MTDDRVGGDARGRLIAALAALFVVGLLSGGGVGWLQHARAADQGELPPATSTTPAPSPSSEPPASITPNASVTPSQTPERPRTSTPSRAQIEAKALQALAQKNAADRRTTSVSGQWVAQVSSKYVGVHDKWQRTTSGSHTFRASDILAEHKELRSRFGGTGPVVLLRGQDWGAGLTHKGDGATFWYTFVLGDFSSKADAADFCERAYPDYSGDRREDYCFPRRLVPRR